MTWAQEQGVTTFDFLRGSEQLKDEFGAELQLDHFYERRVGLTGRALAVKWGRCGDDCVVRELTTADPLPSEQPGEGSRRWRPTSVEAVRWLIGNWTWHSLDS
jgi:hypothetical protein